jgi:hypothetical protein
MRGAGEECCIMEYVNVEDEDFLFETLGTTYPVTQFHIPEDPDPQ